MGKGLSSRHPHPHPSSPKGFCAYRTPGCRFPGFSGCRPCVGVPFAAACTAGGSLFRAFPLQRATACKTRGSRHAKAETSLKSECGGSPLRCYFNHAHPSVGKHPGRRNVSSSWKRRKRARERERERDFRNVSSPSYACSTAFALASATSPSRAAFSSGVIFNAAARPSR